MCGNISRTGISARITRCMDFTVLYPRPPIRTLAVYQWLTTDKKFIGHILFMVVHAPPKTFDSQCRIRIRKNNIVITAGVITSTHSRSTARLCTKPSIIVFSNFVNYCSCRIFRWAEYWFISRPAGKWRNDIDAGIRFTARTLTGHFTCLSSYCICEEQIKYSKGDNYSCYFFHWRPPVGVGVNSVGAGVGDVGLLGFGHIMYVSMS